MADYADPDGAACVGDLDEIADLYSACAVRVRRLVRLGVTAPDAVIDDACSVAWMRLVLHRERVRRDTAVRWLARVAVNEARRQLARGGRDVSLDEMPEGSSRVPQAPDLLEDIAERRARLADLRALPERQRRLMWLQGFGFSYREMAGVTGDTRRTVDRQLARARSTLGRAGT
jgi:RNA polymerase sigma factor (sigma-70 family)